MSETVHIKVLVSHRIPLVQTGLIAALREEPSIEARARESGPDSNDLLDGSALIAILDVEQGLRVAETLSRANQVGMKPCRLIVIADQTSAWDVREALRLGVFGIYRLDTPMEQLVRAVQSLARGERSFDDAAMACMAQSYLLPDLTQREHDVLALLSDGDCNKEIARHLGIAAGTVKSHVRSILEKLGARTRLRAIAIAKERGMHFKRRLQVSAPSRVAAPERARRTAVC